MKVLELSDMYPPNLGGTEQHVQVLSRWLTSNGHPTEVVTMHRADLPEREVDEFGVVVHRLRGWSSQFQRIQSEARQTYHPTFPDPGLMRSLHRVIDEFQPDIIHAHGWISQSLGALNLSGPNRPATLVTLHDNSLACVRKVMSTPSGASCPGRSTANCTVCATQTYGQLMGRIHLLGLSKTGKYMASVDQTIAVSSYVKEVNEALVLAAGAPAIKVITSFCRDAVLTRLPSDPAVALPKRFAMTAGVVIEEKGTNLLNEIWADIGSRLDIDLVVVGPDRRKDKQPWSPRVHFVGPQQNHEVVAIMNRCEFVISPSICADSFPTVNVEAMALGKALVASAVGGIVDQVTNNVNGILVPPGEGAPLLAAIERLALHPEVSASFGAEGRKKAHLFGIEAVGPQLLDCFDDTLTTIRAQHNAACLLPA